MSDVTPVGALALLFLIAWCLLSCTGRESPVAGWTHAGECQAHTECGSGEVCLEAHCEKGASAQPATVSQEAAQRYFTGETCVRDAECGPWICVDGDCVEPEARVEVPRRDSFRYWDLSCRDADDCGQWMCADGWCADPARLASQPCAVDDECPIEGSACVYPGVCSADAADLPFNFSELLNGPWSSEHSSCDHDTDCGPWICVNAACIPPEEFLPSVPANHEIRYADASCRSGDDCGIWVCQNGYCHDPNRHRSSFDLVATFSTDTLDGTSTLFGTGVGGGLFGTATGGALVQPSGTGGALQGYAQRCSQQVECASGAACVPPGTCVVGADILPMDVSGLNAPQWFTNVDGSCASDPDCGPWICHNGTCAEPASVGFVMQEARQYRFYDTSCSSTSDCGAWVCQDGWCTRP